jgi:hypothetical protein
MGVSASFVKEFIDSASRGNYMQDGEISAFVDLVSLAGAGLAGSVFSLDGGANQIPTALLKASGATVLTSTPVSAVSDSGAVTYTDASSNTPQTSTFDAVIIAAPLEFADIALSVPAPPPTNRPYMRVFVTFFSCDALSPSYFNLSETESVPGDIATIDGEGLEIVSVGYHGRGDNGKKVYKLFSLAELSDDVLSRISSNHGDVFRHEWEGAYTVRSASEASTKR